MRKNRLRRRYACFAVNHFYSGTHFFKRKRSLLRWAGFQIGENTKIVGPLFCTADLVIGRDCWIGRDFCVEGNGYAKIGDGCDLAPHVTLLTGSHLIGDADRRAGKGINTTVTVGNGVWIGANATVIGNCSIGSGSVVAACACVKDNVEENRLFGGVPAKQIKVLD